MTTVGRHGCTEQHVRCCVRTRSQTIRHPPAAWLCLSGIAIRLSAPCNQANHLRVRRGAQCAVDAARQRAAGTAAPPNTAPRLCQPPEVRALWLARHQRAGMQTKGPMAGAGLQAPAQYHGYGRRVDGRKSMCGLCRDRTAASDKHWRTQGRMLRIPALASLKS